jgi:hypothetical protein
MGKQCPFCQRELKDSAKYCLGCGRQIDQLEGPEGTAALTDLKFCYGSFPLQRKMECYLCADLERCARHSDAERMRSLQTQIEALTDRLESLGGALASLHGTMVDGFNKTLDGLSVVASCVRNIPR